MGVAVTHAPYSPEAYFAAGAVMAVSAAFAVAFLQLFNLLFHFV
jgi:hypothetical protein